MAFNKITKDMNIIAALDDEPNDVGGLSAAQLKAKFDEGGLALKTFINNLIDAIAAGTAAANIGAEDLNGVATDLQTALDNIAGAVIGTLPDGAVTTAKLHDGAVTDAKIDFTDSALTRVEIQSYVGTGATTPTPTVISFENVPKYVVVLVSQLSNSGNKSASSYYPNGTMWAWQDVVAASAATYRRVPTAIFSASYSYQSVANFTLSNGNKTISLTAVENYGGGYDAKNQLNMNDYTYTVVSFY